jgi:hypothetical protein
MSLLLLFKENPRFYFGATAHGPATTGPSMAKVAPVPAPATSHGPATTGPGVAESAAVAMPRAPDPLRTMGISTAESTAVAVGTTSHQGIGWAAGSGARAVAMPVASVLRASPAPQAGASAAVSLGTTGHQGIGSSAFTEIVIVPAPATSYGPSATGSALTHGGVAVALPASSFGGSVPGEGVVFGVFFSMPAAGSAPRVVGPVSVLTGGSVGVPMPAAGTAPKITGASGSASRAIVVPSTSDQRAVPAAVSGSRFLTVQAAGAGRAPTVPGLASIGPAVYFFFGVAGSARPKTTGMGLSYVITFTTSAVLIDIEELAIVELDIDDGGLDL